jgi:uncharacterized LabA/DUF88 family protein
VWGDSLVSGIFGGFYMQQLLVLVDFDNYASLNDVPGQRPKNHHIERCIEQLISYVISWTEERDKHPSEITLRLYGGWYNDRNIESKTDLRHMVDGFCFNAPKRRGKYRIRISTVDSPLFYSNIVMTYTLQESIQTINIKNYDLDQCELKENCVTRIVDGWQKNGCPGCVVKHTDLLRIQHQKNVDTMIVADIIYSTLQAVYDCIIIVSADYDMLPGILFAQIKMQQIVIFRKFESVWFDSMLMNCEIQSGITPRYRDSR